MTAEQFARLKAELEEGFQGPRRAGRPLLLEGGLDWKPLSLSPKDMDFIAARNGAAREIALAFGVPPMLLGIPGDNTYSNYQEAQRAFWRSTVLPLVTRTAKALSSWLAPAWEVLPKAGNGSGSGKPSLYPGRGAERLELRPDLDQIEALTSEREALWARIEKVSFLTLNEKRAAVGYAPLEEQEPPARATEGDVPVVMGKYRPDQARAPAGTPEGGEWVDEGRGTGSRLGTSVASGVSAPARDDRAKEEYVRVAQAGGNYGIDVTEEDRLGGHTFERHVGKSDEYLVARILGNRINIPFLGLEGGEKRAGSFSSLDAANKLVNATLADPKNQASIEAFVRRDFFYSLPELNLYKEFKQPTGKEAYGPGGRKPEMRVTYWVRVRLRRSDKAEKGYYVYSAFPLNRD